MAEKVAKNPGYSNPSLPRRVILGQIMNTLMRKDSVMTKSSPAFIKSLQRARAKAGSHLQSTFQLLGSSDHSRTISFDRLRGPISLICWARSSGRRGQSYHCIHSMDKAKRIINLVTNYGSFHNRNEYNTC